MKSRRGLDSVEVCVIAALSALLIAASAPSLVQIRRAPGEATLITAHIRFVQAVGDVHRRWVLAGSGARTIRIEDREIHVNQDGWPALGPDLPQQRSAAQLFEKLVPAFVLQEPWEAREVGGPLPIASFHLLAPGGGSFSYDPATGIVSEPSRRSP